MLYPWPEPEVIGLALAPDHVATVDSVTAGSIAATAGLKAGDQIISLAGQPLISIADTSWVLNYSPDPGRLAAVVKRDGAEKAIDLTLPAGWRKKSDISRRVGTWSLRGMATGGLVLEDVTDDARVERGWTRDQMALRVKYVGEYGTHAAAKKAGFKKDDVIVLLDGKSTRMTEGEMIGDMLQNHPPGDQVKATVMRGSDRMEFMLPIQ
jgi:S1-C subfamily serine protease